MTLEVVLAVVGGGRGEVKLKVGNAELLMGSEMVGRSTASATYGQETSMSNIVCNANTKGHKSWLFVSQIEIEKYNLEIA